MKKISLVLIVFILTGCAVFSSGKVKLPADEVSRDEQDTVYQSLRVSPAGLWESAVIEMRRGQIIESDRVNWYIKSFTGQRIVEFKIESIETEGRKTKSAFSLKAYTLEGKPDLEKAKRIARLIAKRASAGWFFF
jgi:hypothetical protein